MNAELRFWNKVEKTETCWNWQATLFHSGYGQFWGGKKNVRAHRFSYELVNGKIPHGLTIDHLCRNHRCVNPAHLEAVTLKENILRGTSPSALNHLKTSCIRGHKFNSRNTIIWNNGKRACVKCRKARESKLKEEKP